MFQRFPDLHNRIKWLNQFIQNKHKGSARGARPPVSNFSRVNFWLHNTHKLYCYQHAMLTIIIMHFILYSAYKSIGYVSRGIKTIWRPKKLYRAGIAPPGIRHWNRCKFPSWKSHMVIDVARWFIKTNEGHVTHWQCIIYLILL